MRILRALIGLSALGVLVAALAALAVLADRPVVVAIQPGPDGDRLVLRSGDPDLPALVVALHEMGWDGTVEADGDTYLLNVPLKIARGARLRLDGVELRLLSAPGRVVGIEALGGDLSIRASKVTSWDPGQAGPDSDPADGRAFIVARDGTRMDVVDSTVTMLGYDEFGRYGVTWRGRGTGGRVSGSLFLWNHHGAYLHDADGMRITDSRFEGSFVHGLDLHTSSLNVTVEDNAFRGNGAHGLIVAVDSSGARVKANEAAGNAEHGIVVLSGSDHALVEDNRSRDNGKAGISVSASMRSRLVGNEVYENRMGIAVQDGSRDVVIEDNTIRANAGDGVRVSSSNSSAILTRNEIVSNGAAGVFVDDGSVEIGRDNRLASNRSGIKVDDDRPRLRVVGSVIEYNQEDGLNLRGTGGVDLKGNSLRGNGKAAVSLGDPAGSAAFLDGNEVGPHPSGSTRLRRPAA